MKTVIVTGFEPFGEDTLNPTEKILAQIPSFLFNAKVIKLTLPVVYEEAFNTLQPLIDEYQPEAIILLGLAGGRTHISIERIAMNMNHSDAPDNKGNILKFKKIISDGEDGIFTNYPLETLMDRIHQAKLPVVISNTAGGYICNDIMYRTLHYLKNKNFKSFAGFVHVPYLPEQVLTKNQPSMALKPMIDTVLLLINELVNPIEPT